MRKQYTYSDQSFTFNEPIKIEKSRRAKNRVHKTEKESLDLKLDYVMNNIVNNLYKMIHEDENIDMRRVEKIILLSLKEKFNKTQAAKLTGLSLRTVRNKFNGYSEIQ